MTTSFELSAARDERSAARFERSAALCLRAYPRRWRDAQGAELVEVLADLSAPEARRVDLGAALGMVASGWGVRWRAHPPLRPWLAYHLLSRHLPPRYDGWVRDEKLGLLTGVRSTLLIDVVVLPAWLAIVAVAHALRGIGWPFVVGAPFWWANAVLLVWWSVQGGVGRRAALAEYFPMTDPTPHFGPYVPLRLDEPERRR